MTLKLAQEEDYGHVVRMANAFHQASPYSDCKFDINRLRLMWDQYLRDKKRLCVILACDPNPYGMIVGMSSELPFSSDLATMEMAWWVDEERRGSRESLLLMKAYEDWAVRVGAKVIQMAMLDESTNLDKFYLRQGYRPAERSYIKEI